MEGPPPGIDLSASQVPRILGVNIATFCLAVFAILLRFTARRLTRAAFWWDDWLMLPAILFSAVIFFLSMTYSIGHGLGRHIWVAPMDARFVWAKGLFISEVSYTIVICSVKFSLLAFYWRIFKQSKIRVPIYVLGAIVSCWGIAVIFITILQCHPVSDFWNRFAPNAKGSFHCGVNENHFFDGNSIPNIVTDAAILVLPMPFVWQLHLSKAQKLALTSVFIFGIFVVGVSIARFTFVIGLDLVSPDITWNFVNCQIWTGVESHVAIICACLPSLRPLLNLVLFGSVNRSHDRNDDNELGGLSGRTLHIWDSNLTTNQIRRGGPITKTADMGSDRGFARLPEEGSTEEGLHISASNNESNDLHPYQGIMVRTDVYVGEDDKE